MGTLVYALTNLLVQKTAIKYGIEVGGVKTDDSLKVCCYGDAVLKLHPHTMQDLPRHSKWVWLWVWHSKVGMFMGKYDGHIGVAQ